MFGAVTADLGGKGGIPERLLHGLVIKKEEINLFTLQNVNKRLEKMWSNGIWHHLDQCYHTYRGQ